MWTSEFYLTRLYPVQNQALRLITDLGTEFYLTGGIALSRGYLNHRFSDDLDFFVNRASARAADPQFANLADWEAIRWINLPDPDQYLVNLVRPGEALIFGDLSKHTE